jgi:hypothetical protein
MGQGEEEAEAFMRNDFKVQTENLSIRAVNINYKKKT